MQPVVADTGPPHYLVLIGAIDVLPQLFGRVLIPDVVASELLHEATPTVVRTWIQAPPLWLERHPIAPSPTEAQCRRDAGERAAIALAEAVGAQLLLIDDRAGDRAAQERGLTTIGTLGILLRAAQQELVDLDAAFARLDKTNFRARPELFAALLAQHKARKS